jgi:hypothetical protein
MVELRLADVPWVRIDRFGSTTPLPPCLGSVDGRGDRSLRGQERHLDGVSRHVSSCLNNGSQVAPLERREVPLSDIRRLDFRP